MKKLHGGQESVEILINLDGAYRSFMLLTPVKIPLYHEDKRIRPALWVTTIRNWNKIKEVTLNPEKIVKSLLSSFKATSLKTHSKHLSYKFYL